MPQQRSVYMDAPRQRNGALMGNEMREYKTRSGATQYAPSMDEVREMEDESTGWCLACGATGQPAEPDAVRYTCDECGKAKVFGCMELVLMGLVRD